MDDYDISPFEEHPALVDASDSLNTATVELQYQFDRIEEQLSEICLFVTAWTDGLIGVRKTPGYGYKFGYCRIGPKWKLVCRRVDVDEDGNYDASAFDQTSRYGLLHPINTMPRDIKCEAAQAIPQLLERIQQASGKIVYNVQAAIDNLREAGSALDAVISERRVES